MNPESKGREFDPYDFEKRDINGVSVWSKHLPWAPCIHIRVVFTVGGFSDPVGKEGLSHFLEHMMFNGSPTLPDKKAVIEWGKKYTLNTWNAWTSNSLTGYWFKCLPEHFETALAGLTDQLFSPLLKAEDVEHERKVITQEAWGRFQNEKYLKYSKESIENLFHGHEHARIDSPLGWPETVAKISHADVREWHKKHYGKGNFFIVIAGQVEDTHIALLETFLKDVPVAEANIRVDGTVQKPIHNKLVRNSDDIGEVNEQAEFSIIRVAQAIDESKRAVASASKRLLYDILHERLRVEQSLCYSVHVRTWPARSFMETGISVKMDEKNIDIVEKEFWNTVQEIKEGTHTERFDGLLKVGLEQVVSRERLSGDIADEVIEDIDRYGVPTPLATTLEAMAKVTYADVVEFITDTFDPEFVFTEVILPSRK